MGFLHGKRALIVGIASQRSIATGIAEAMHREGARTGLHLPEREAQVARRGCRRRIRQRTSCCPATSPTTRRSTRASANSASTGTASTSSCTRSRFAPREAIDGEFLDGLTRENFRIAHDISGYCLAALAKAARPMMKGRNGSILTLSYLGAERALAELQRHGRGQGQPGSERALPRAATSARKARASTRSRPARSRPWPRPASPTSARCSATSRSTRRCAAASPSRTSATSPRSCARTWPPASPARSPTSTPATTSWA